MLPGVEQQAAAMRRAHRQRAARNPARAPDAPAATSRELSIRFTV